MLGIIFVLKFIYDFKFYDLKEIFRFVRIILFIEIRNIVIEGRIKKN